LTSVSLYIIFIRKLQFDLVVEKDLLYTGLETLEDAVSGFLHLCFTVNLEYPKVSVVMLKYFKIYRYCFFHSKRISMSLTVKES